MFNPLSITKVAGSFVLGCFVLGCFEDSPTPSFTMKLMRISSNLYNVDYLLSTGQGKEIIWVSKGGVDLILVIPSLLFPLSL